VPLGVKISHIGSSPVKADIVTMGMPASSAGEMAAISELRTGFPPGHFFDLDGEKLLARSGFEDLQGGCRMATATTPKLGAAAQENVAYRTYVRNPDDRFKADLTPWTFAKLSGAYAASSNIGRATQVKGNPYVGKRPDDPPVAVSPRGTSVLTDAATGATLLAGAGAMSATEAGAILDAINAAGFDGATRTAVRR
jgi:hypothetical protein